MIRLFLIRHGETDWNAEGRLQGHSPSVLSARGRAEATALRKRLPANFEQWPVYCSDLQRTRETAQLLLDQPEAPLRQSALLREIALGEWEGRLRRDVQAQAPALFHTFQQSASQFSIPGGESFHDVQQRGLAFVQQLLEEGVEGNILVVSHRGLIKSLLLQCSGGSLDEIWSEPGIPNCSVSVLSISRNGDKSIERYGDTGSIANQ